MPFADGSINLNWAAQIDEALGLGSFGLTDRGRIAVLQRDGSSQREYILSSVDSVWDDKQGRPLMQQLAVFASDPVGDVEIDSAGTSLYLLNDTAVHFLMVAKDGELSHGMLQIRLGDSFLGLKAAGFDSHHTAAIITTDRAATVHTLSLLEAPADERASAGSQSVALNLLWNKAWTERITAASISRDGRYIAVAVGKGDVALMTRERRTLWANAAVGEHPIAALAVDTNGSVVTVGDSGQVRFLSGGDGELQWEVNVPVGEEHPAESVKRAVAAVDDRGGLVIAAVNTQSVGEGLNSIYSFVDGSTGDLLWQDTIGFGTSGVSISGSGHFAALSTLSGETLLFGSENHKPHFIAEEEILVKPTDMPQLIKKAKIAFDAFKYEKAVELMADAAKIDPAVGGHVSLYEDSIWNLREVILSETKDVNRDTLAQVEAALLLLPHDERLTIRRNALARIIAESLGKEAGQKAVAGNIEGAVELLREALKIDPTQTELRQTLRNVTDAMAIRLFAEADDALHEEKFDDAIEILIRLEAMRPGEEAVVNRLEQARGVQAFSAGMRCYVKARYTEACFWFRKSLALMPDNDDAKRHLEMSSRFAGQKQKKETALKPVWSSSSVVNERTSSV